MAVSSQPPPTIVYWDYCACPLRKNANIARIFTMIKSRIWHKTKSKSSLDINLYIPSLSTEHGLPSLLSPAIHSSANIQIHQTMSNHVHSVISRDIQSHFSNDNNHSNNNNNGKNDKNDNNSDTNSDNKDDQNDDSRPRAIALIHPVAKSKRWASSIKSNSSISHVFLIVFAGIKENQSPAPSFIDEVIHIDCGCRPEDIEKWRKFKGDFVKSVHSVKGKKSEDKTKEIESGNSMNSKDKKSKKKRKQKAKGGGNGNGNENGRNCDDHKEEGNNSNSTNCKQSKSLKIESTKALKRRMQSEVEMIRLWMMEHVELKQYFKVFIENGYDCIEMVLDMKREHLVEIGIVNEQHQTMIIALLPLLNGTPPPMMNTKKNKETKEHNVSNGIDVKDTKKKKKKKASESAKSLNSKKTKKGKETGMETAVSKGEKTCNLPLNGNVNQRMITRPAKRRKSRDGDDEKSNAAEGKDVVLSG